MSNTESHILLIVSIEFDSIIPTIVLFHVVSNINPLEEEGRLLYT